MIVSLEILRIIGPNLVHKINSIPQLLLFPTQLADTIVLPIFPVVVCMNPRTRFGCLIVVLQFKYIIANTLATI